LKKKGKGRRWCIIISGTLYSHLEQIKYCVISVIFIVRILWQFLVTQTVGILMYYNEAPNLQREFWTQRFQQCTIYCGDFNKSGCDVMPYSLV
jgi:hypothetical protein